ncbi:MAG: hypothetical protein ACFFC7_34185 [Candidatus Hermodarchaeota archaeon]
MLIDRLKAIQEEMWEFGFEEEENKGYLIDFSRTTGVTTEEHLKELVQQNILEGPFEVYNEYFGSETITEYWDGGNHHAYVLTELIHRLENKIGSINLDNVSIFKHKIGYLLSISYQEIIFLLVCREVKLVWR